ncbi:MAG: UDP-glucose 4-epimerase GalE [Clostridia bacterium]|nr:UDP-glucose 4-epimerase GalE [Clostridia bacterium]MBP5238313.1 UDP-glucose 4-epimerase GalE [Clostridia bacterium]MBR5031929.1 UDP-glucose 4-epimerase GalE [Clostridia bacterium]
MQILVTGGMGYIGSHTVIELIRYGHTPVIVDNLSNSKITALDGIEKISGVRPEFYELDVCDKAALSEVFKTHKFASCIHFAGLKAVGESVRMPLEYYKNNLLSTITLLECMRENGCRSIIFSSSATVYGDPASLPIKEDFPLSTTNPYGTTKLMIERILRDFQFANKEYSVTLLRYFNPIGAHPSGLLGEDPNGIPNNLLPVVMKAAKGELTLNVFGNDYDTPDGTGVRDYIHVCDLAAGHTAALKNAFAPGVYIYNLGTGNGFSVLEIINTFERVNGVKVPYVITARRPGDIAACYADSSKAERELGFKAVHGIEDMCRDAWNYAKDR